MDIVIDVCRSVSITECLDRDRIEIGDIVLKLDKMCRLFFFSEDKFYSVALPFSFRFTDNKNIDFYWKEICLTSQMWSWLKRLVNSDISDLENDEECFEFLMNLEEKGIDFRELSRSFRDSDFGYVRYDYDPDSFRIAKNNGRPHSHPLNHCDIHLANYSTFKTGLTKSLKPEEFIELVDNEQDRWYVTRHENIQRGVISQMFKN